MAMEQAYPVWEDLFTWNRLLGSLASMGWIKVTSNTLTLTQVGHDKAHEMEAIAAAMR
jgi:hypothetical protein